MPQLADFLAPEGARLLIQGISDKLFIPGHEVEGVQEVGEHMHAPKITKEDTHVDWKTWTATDVIRREHVLGPLWNWASPWVNQGDSNVPEPLKRIIMQGIKEDLPCYDNRIRPGVPFVQQERSAKRLLARTCDDKLLEISHIKVEGTQSMPAVEAAEKARMCEVGREVEGAWPMVMFHHALQ